MLIPEEIKNSIRNGIGELNSANKGLVSILHFSIKGNLEPFEQDIEDELSSMFILNKTTILSLTTLEDEGRTRMTLKFMETKHIGKHIDMLNEKLRIRQTPKQYLPALNKAIMIAEQFNNLFGEGIHNKTAEINELDEILQKLKD